MKFPINLYYFDLISFASLYNRVCDSEGKVNFLSGFFLHATMIAL